MKQTAAVSKLQNDTACQQWRTTGSHLNPAQSLTIVLQLQLCQLRSNGSNGGAHSVVECAQWQRQQGCEQRRCCSGSGHCTCVCCIAGCECSCFAFLSACCCGCPRGCVRRVGLLHRCACHCSASFSEPPALAHESNTATSVRHSVNCTVTHAAACRRLRRRLLRLRLRRLQRAGWPGDSTLAQTTHHCEYTTTHDTGVGD